jgi:carbamoyl-phosphate synthase large subunit
MDKTVLVTSAGCYSGVNVIKSLKSTKKYRIVATDFNPLSAGLFRADVGYIVPKENRGGNVWIDRMLDICKKEHVDLIIPCFDTEMPYMLKHKSKFESLGAKVLIGSDKLVYISNDKYELQAFLATHKFPFLRTWIGDTVTDEMPNRAKFPMVVKPRYGWGQRGFFEVHNRVELDYALDDNKKHGYESVIQEYIGESEGEFTNSVIVATGLDILGVICMKRTLIKGESRTMEVAPFPELSRQMVEIAKAIGSAGPINLQCRVKEGKAYVFEINCRFSTTNVVRAVCGFNEADVLAENFLTGKKTHIAATRDAVVVTYLDYVYLDQSKYKNLKGKGVIKGGGEIYPWL